MLRIPKPRVLSAPQSNGSLATYRVIEAVLREQILSGEYAAGDRLPTEAQLCVMFRASRPTVRQALRGIELENLVSREHGRGTFVKALPAGQQPDRYTFSLEQLIEPSRPIRIAIQRSGSIKGYSVVHEMMRLPRGAGLFYFVRIYSLGAQPIGAGKVHVPDTLRTTLRNADLVARNFPQTLATRAHTRLSSSTLAVDAMLAEPRFADMLMTRAGAPLMRVLRTSFDKRGVAIEHTNMRFRPDLCHLVHTFRATKRPTT
jgi:GntR family transcriptional regulator